MHSGNDITQIPAEFTPTELPSTELPSAQPFELCTAPATEPRVAQPIHGGVHGSVVVQQTALANESGPFGWGMARGEVARGEVVRGEMACRKVLRWGTVAIAATAIAQTLTMLVTSLVAPTFARKIELAQTRNASVKISAMNQAQQVYFLDHGTFSQELVSLNLGIVAQGQYYDYRIQTPPPVRSRRHRPNQLAQQGLGQQELAQQMLEQQELEQQELEQQELKQQMVVSLALPREPGLPTLWGAIASQASEMTVLGDDPAEFSISHRLTDSLICKKPAPPKNWFDQLRQQLQPKSVKYRSRDSVPAVPRRLECPAGFAPTSFAGRS